MKVQSGTSSVGSGPARTSLGSTTTCGVSVKCFLPDLTSPPYTTAHSTQQHLTSSSYQITSKTLPRPIPVRQSINQKSKRKNIKMAADLKTQPPSSESFLLSYPAPHILLLTINRPKARNSIHYQAHWDADAILNWFDAEPSLRKIHSIPIYPHSTVFPSQTHS